MAHHQSPVSAKTSQQHAMERHLHEQISRDSRILKNHSEPRSRVNEWAKLIVSNANFVFTIMSFIIISGSLYLLLADFGDLDKGFFYGIAIMLFMFGLIVLMVSYLGGQGIFYQRRDSKFTIWKGSLILSIYQIFLIATLICEIGWVAVSMDAFVLLRNNADLVIDGNPPALSSMEQKIALKFNAFFFGAASQCATLKYEWFWSFVNKRCAPYNENMSQLLCQRCEEYSVVMCAADTSTCYEGDVNAIDNVGCPYQACRKGILEFILDRFPPFSYFAIGFVGFQIILVISSCVLICYHQRDTDAEIKAKNGIFTQRSASQENAMLPPPPKSPPSSSPHHQAPPRGPAHAGRGASHGGRHGRTTSAGRAPPRRPTVLSK